MPILHMVFAEAQPRKEGVRERLGRVLDNRFRLEACIGSGGTGAVYRARVIDVAADLPSRVAVKILHPHLVADAGHRDVFLKEARISALVGHPGAVRVYDARVTTDGTAYLVLEYLEGRSLQDALVGWGDLLVDEVVRVTKGILAILASAHDHGVVHCDIKPENVFVLGDGKVKLLDFGIARIVGGARRTGVAGTAAFMAPEQARGDWSHVDARADVWSVGATFYTLITGESMPAGAAFVLPADVPAPIAAVIVRALCLDPRARWPNARLMLDALIEAAVKSGLPRSSRSVVALDDDDDNAMFEPAATPEVDESTEPFMLVVPPYPVSLDSLTTPVPRLSSFPAPAPASPRSAMRARNQWLVAAVVVAAAGVLGAGLAMASSLLIDDVGARIPRPASSVQVTAGELRR